MYGMSAQPTTDEIPKVSERKRPKRRLFNTIMFKLVISCNECVRMLAHFDLINTSSLANNPLYMLVAGVPKSSPN